MLIVVHVTTSRVPDYVSADRLARRLGESLQFSGVVKRADVALNASTRALIVTGDVDVASSPSCAVTLGSREVLAHLQALGSPLTISHAEAEDDR